jgi:class 3 adenylate cyclase
LKVVIDKTLLPVKLKDSNTAVLYQPIAAHEKPADWKILIVDNEVDVHSITQLVFRGFEFEGRKIRFFSAYSGAEARELIREHPDMAVILLDIIMESEIAGLDFVHYLRKVLKFHLPRIILRTAVSGATPEYATIMENDINDYEDKIETTPERLVLSVTIALREFRDLMKLEERKNHWARQLEGIEPFVPRSLLGLLHNERNVGNLRMGDAVDIELTIMVVSIPLSGNLTATDQPIELFELFQVLLAVSKPAIVAAGGLVDLHISGNILGFFSSSPAGAIDAALNILAALRGVNRERIAKRQRPLDGKIAIHYGPVTVGIVGTATHLSCVAIGDTLATAGQICELEELPVLSLYISATALDRLEGREKYSHRLCGGFHLGGQHSPIAIHEITETR